MTAPRFPLRWITALSLGLLTVACTSGPLVPAPGDDGGGENVTPLKGQNVELGLALSGEASQTFAGEWTVVERPDWLQVTPLSGKGTVALRLKADRAAATSLKADAASLSGQIKITWSGGTDALQGGTVTWTVNAEQYLLTGRVLENASAHGQDLRVGAAVSPAPADTETQARGVIVKYREAGGSLTAQASTRLTTERAVDSLRAAHLTVTSSRPLSARSAALDVPDVPAALRVLRADPQVEYAVPNAVLRAQTLPQSGVPAPQATQASVPLAQPVTPTDQYAGLQWPFRLLGYPAVWRDMEAGAYSRPVTVAVIDSGVRYDHPDLAGQLWKPGEGALDFLPDTRNGDGDGVDTDPTDPGDTSRYGGSHGTHVTGLIVARWGQNEPSCAGCSLTGVVGASYRAAVKVLPLRVIDAAGDATEAEVALAVRYAAGLPVSVTDSLTNKKTTYTAPHKAAVINLSLGGPISAGDARPMCDAIQEASDAGALVIVAAGNGYNTVPYYPAACPAAVSVGSVTLSGGSAPKHAVYSNAYAAVQLSAPGGTDPVQDPGTFNGGTFNGQPFKDLVLSTSWDYAKNQPNYEAEAGTSQAAPQVSALAALLLSKGVTTDAASTLARLKATATDLGAAGRDPLFGFGMINAAAALGAPAISDTLGLRLQDARGLVFQPALDALGRFNAYLGDGAYRVIGGKDRDSNGIYGEAGEPRSEKSVTLGPVTPKVEVGNLVPQE